MSETLLGIIVGVCFGGFLFWRIKNRKSSAEPGTTDVKRPKRPTQS